MFVKTVSILGFTITSCISMAQPTKVPVLEPPLLLEKEKMLKGNPLATYKMMLSKENEYLSSPLARMYKEQKAMLEEFLGVPTAGTKAMELFKTKWDSNDTVPGNYVPYPAEEVIVERASRTQIVIWGEEHHLPQTRDMYSYLLHELWKLGYRYLAAEAFSSNIGKYNSWVDYEAGLYTRDPLYALAIHDALQLGYRLVPYETNERGPDNDPSFRDRTQAENIKKIFDTDPAAKVFVIAGRGHASEEPAQDGWMPMAATLKKITGVDPLTLFTPTMTERSTNEEEHPAYVQATRGNKLKRNSIFLDPQNGNLFGSGSFDAYVFFPKMTVSCERPDWLFTVQERKRVKIKNKYLKHPGTKLIQAFMDGQDTTHIPVDQFLSTNEQQVCLALPRGKYSIRIIDGDGNVLAKIAKKVKK